MNFWKNVYKTFSSDICPGCGQIYEIRFGCIYCFTEGLKACHEEKEKEAIWAREARIEEIAEGVRRGIRGKE
jgi:hypothetical protein